MSLALAIAALTIANAPTAAPNDQPSGYAIIWGGGASPADADAAMKTWQDAAVGLGGFFVFPAGFPKIVESVTIPGLKPGFHVVLLGLCPFDDALVPLSLAKLKNAGAYGRRTSAATAATCPRLSKEFKAGARFVIEQPDVTLRAVVVERDYNAQRLSGTTNCDKEHEVCAKGGPGCPCNAARGETCQQHGPWTCTTTTDLDNALLLELRDRNDTSLDARIITADDLDGSWCESIAITGEKDAITLKAECAVPYCSTPTTIFTTSRITIAKKRIAVKRTSTEKQQGQCD